MGRESNTGRIYEFDSVIYPMRLWVAINPDFEDADKEFYFLNDDGEIVDDARDDFNGHYNAIATTFCVTHKENGWKGALVVIWRRRECGAGICAHEATHVFDWLEKELGLGCQEWGNDEPKAYYVQWVANNIDKVLRNRV